MHARRDQLASRTKVATIIKAKGGVCCPEHRDEFITVIVETGLIMMDTSPVVVITAKPPPLGRGLPPEFMPRRWPAVAGAAGPPGVGGRSDVDTGGTLSIGQETPVAIDRSKIRGGRMKPPSRNVFVCPSLSPAGGPDSFRPAPHLTV